MSPACPLRMLVWTSLKKNKSPASITHTHYPHLPARTMEHLPTTSSFPRSLKHLVPTVLSSSEEPGHCYLSSDCSHEDTHTHNSLLTLVHLVASLTSTSLSSLASNGNFHQLEVIATLNTHNRCHWSGAGHSTDGKLKRGVQGSKMAADTAVFTTLVPM